MRSRSICSKAILVISASLLIFSLGGKNEVASKALSQTTCGEWNLVLNGGREASQDGKISVKLVHPADLRCEGVYTLNNKTGVASIGGYTLELVVDSQNADVRVLETTLLTPYRAIDIKAEPQDKNKAALVKIQGQMTKEAYLFDFAYLTGKSIIKHLIPSSPCIIPDESLAMVTIRLMDITSHAAAEFGEGNFRAAAEEFLGIFDALLEAMIESLKEAGENCAVEALKLKLGKVATQKIQIFLDVAKWLVPWYRDYFKGEWSYLTLSYFATGGTNVTPEPTSPIAITPTPIVEPTGGPSDPNYVYEQVKNTIKYKDASYLQEFFTGEWELGSMHLVSCQAYSSFGWSPPALEELEDYMHGDLNCEGIEYTSRLLTFSFSGWEPDVPECGIASSGGSDNAIFIFYRETESGDFKLVSLFNGTISERNWGGLGGKVGNLWIPYNLIPCDTQNIPNFEQAICQGAQPQRLKIGEQGYVCAPEGVDAAGQEFYGGDVLGQKSIPFGTEFTVNSGPFCTGDGKSWFNVGTTISWIGYVPEAGDEEGEYYLCPGPAPSQSPVGTTTPGQSSCPGAPLQRLTVGNRAKVCSSVNSVKIRSTPGMSGSRITSLPSNSEIDVIGGPVCAGNNWSWWEVRTDGGQVGWMAEGGDEVDPYFLCPINESPVIPATGEFDCSLVTDVSLKECRALVKLYNSTGGPDWAWNTNWLSSSSVKDWYGVTVNNGHVTKLQLFTVMAGNNLTGSIPAELVDLIYLDHLELRENKLRGLIPPELGKLNNLTYLDLSYNQLSGRIPPELGKSVKLTELSLVGNQLSGEIPSELGNLAELTNLYLYENQLSGEIPSELGNLTNLYRLLLGGNNLIGPIPSKLGDLTNLWLLELSDNRLSGPIPPELGSLINLDTIRLQNNELSGQIPPELGNLNNLYFLELSHNQLSGSIPAELGNLTDLRYVYLENNDLNGSVPLSFTNLQLIKFIFHNTLICEPNQPGFLAWKLGVEGYIGNDLVCGN